MNTLWTRDVGSEAKDGNEANAARHATRTMFRSERAESELGLLVLNMGFSNLGW
jgi:hypothetical protein